MFTLLTRALTHPVLIWEFPKIGGTLFWGPYNKILLFRVLYTILGSLIFGNSHIFVRC